MGQILRVELNELPDTTGGDAASCGADALTREFVRGLGTCETLNAALRRVLPVAAARPAFQTDKATFSYRWLAGATAAVCRRVRSAPGFRPGACVALLCENSPAYVAGFYGILLAGCAVAPLAVDVETDRLRMVVDRCDISLALTAGRLAPRLSTELGDPQETCPLGVAGDCDDGTEGPAHDGVRRDDLAMIMLTAGSSGTPKLVMLSHGNLLANAASIIECLGIEPTDRALTLLPFHHAFGNSILHTHLLIGATLVKSGSFLFPKTVVDALVAQRISSLGGVPEMYRLLLSRTDLGRRPLPDLRYMAVAGGAMPAQLSLEAARRIAPARWFVMYGQSEATARISCLDPQQLERRAASVGRGMPGVTVQVVDSADQPVRPGDVGEVRVRGANVMLGYWRDAETTARTVRQGWLYTGDLATVDDEGYVYVQGRASDLIKLMGYRIHPVEIETLVARRLELPQVVVVACETATTGTRLAMFIATDPQRPAPTADEVLALCAAELPRYKIPAFVEFIDRVPLTPTMKLDRRALERRAAERVAADENHSAALAH
jgi:acyl-CoA synthetase (AMP-forming)/AMP-acid ligase II